MPNRTAGMTMALNQPNTGSFTCPCASQRPLALKPAFSFRPALPTISAEPSRACLL